MIGSMVAPKRKRPSPQSRVRKAAGTRSARRLHAMYQRLVETWGPQQWWPARTPFEVVIGAYLTQNTAWKSVERSIASLEARGILSPDGLRAIAEDELRALIRPSGFMTRKAAALKAFVAFLDARDRGDMASLRRRAHVDAAAVRRQLLDLPGVGPETADAILLYALDVPAMVVDEYLRRVTLRHGLAPQNANYAAIQMLAEQAFSRERVSEGPRLLARHYNEFHALMVQAGKLHCGRVARCEGCPLAFDLRKGGLPPSMHKMKP